MHTPYRRQRQTEVLIGMCVPQWELKSVVLVNNLLLVYSYICDLKHRMPKILLQSMPRVWNVLFSRPFLDDTIVGNPLYLYW